MILKIIIGEVTLDLFKDESISLTSSIADVNDITKNTTDYSRQFTVPASATNNTTFKHYYNWDIDNGFDARTTVDGRIEIDGLPFRVGKFLLTDVLINSNAPTSYKIHFWGNLVDITSLLGKDELSDLDLSAFDHDYNSANVLTGLTGSLSSSNIIYPLLAKKQYYYNSDSNDTTITDSLANIAFNTSSGSNGITWNDLSPAIRLIKIIEAIETKYSLTFSRDFFSRAEFNELFMWLNNNKNRQIGGGSQIVDFDSGDSDNINLSTNIGEFLTKNTAASNDKRYWVVYLYVTPSVGFENVEYTIQFYSDDNDLFAESTFSGTQFLRSELHNEPKGVAEYTYNAHWEIVCDQEFKYTARSTQFHRKLGSTLSSFETFASQNTILSVFETDVNIPKLKVIDFLKGIFQAMKLVVIPRQDGTIFVNTLNSYYQSGTVHDITEWVDTKKTNVSRGNILNEINFNFSDTQTILNKQFDENNGIAYGDEETLLKDSNGKLLTGESLTIKVPFEQIIYERLSDTNDDVQTNVMYGAIIDDKLDPVNPKPHIFYNIPQLQGVKPVAFINDDNNKIELTGNLNIAFHSDLTQTPVNTFLFSEEFSEWNGEKLSNNLFTNYHQTYVNNLFNIKRRNVKFKCPILPLKTLMKLDLNDVLQVGFDFFRIDKFTTDLTTTRTEFEAVNAFDFDITSFSTQQSNIYLNKEAQAYNSYVTNLLNYTVNKIDNGDGTGWLTVTDDGFGNLIFTVTENTGGVRDMFITITNTDTSQTIDYYLNQEIGIIAALDFSVPSNIIQQTILLI